MKKANANNHSNRLRLKHPKDTFHAFMLEGAVFEPHFDMPILEPETIIPDAIIPFSIAKRDDWTNYNCAVHFCERDTDIEPFWNNPGRYMEKILGFQAAFGLDFSTCVDFPRPQKEYNVYRNRVCDSYIQRAGQHVIPLLRGDPDTLEREIAGLTRGCLVAVSPRGCVKELSNRMRFVRGLKYIVDTIEPNGILSYGGNTYGVLDYPISLGIPVYIYPSRGRGNLGGGAFSVKIQ